MENKIKINVQSVCKYDYKIILKVYESDFYKIKKILKHITFQIIDDQLFEYNHFLVELTMDQLTYLLNYFLEKEDK